PLDRARGAQDGQPSAAALLEKIIAAKGGRSVLAGVKSVTATAAATMQTPRGRVETETKTYLEYPNHVRVETKTPQGVQLQVYDGQEGWVRDRFGVYAVPMSELREMDAGLMRDTIAALLSAARGELRVRVLPDAGESGAGQRQVLELSNGKGEALVLSID